MHIILYVHASSHLADEASHIAKRAQLKGCSGCLLELSRSPCARRWRASCVMRWIAGTEQKSPRRRHCVVARGSNRTYRSCPRRAGIRYATSTDTSWGKRLWPEATKLNHRRREKGNVHGTNSRLDELWRQSTNERYDERSNEARTKSLARGGNHPPPPVALFLSLSPPLSLSFSLSMCVCV